MVYNYCIVGSALVQFVAVWWYVSQRGFIVGSDVAQLFVAVVAHILFVLMWHYGQRWFSLAQLVEAYGVVYSLCLILAHCWLRCLCPELQ